MSEASFGVGAYTVGKFVVDGQQVRSESASHDARLVIPLTIAMNPRPLESMIALTGLSCSLHLVPSNAANEINQFGPSVAVHFGSLDCHSIPSNVVDHHAQLRFPLNSSQIRALETHRHTEPNKNFRATIRFQGTLAWMYAVGNSFPMHPNAPPDPNLIVGHPFEPSYGMFAKCAPFRTVKFDPLEFEVDASRWVAQVLPGFDLDHIRIVEIDLPHDGALPHGAAAFFDEGRRDYESGRYGDCIAKCRRLREVVEKQLGATRAKPLATIIADQLAWAVDAPQRKVLDSSWKALVDITNAAHHPERPGIFCAADARFGLLLTAVLLEYVQTLRANLPL
jgi:hypothetical protein